MARQMQVNSHKPRLNKLRLSSSLMALPQFAAVTGVLQQYLLQLGLATWSYFMKCQCLNKLEYILGQCLPAALHQSIQCKLHMALQHQKLYNMNFQSCMQKGVAHVRCHLHATWYQNKQMAL